MIDRILCTVSYTSRASTCRSKSKTSRAALNRGQPENVKPTNAYTLILALNHPSGNPEPSNADKTVTKQIRSSADFIDIELLDHVIIGSNGNYFSFRQEGLFN